MGKLSIRGWKAPFVVLVGLGLQGCFWGSAAPLMPASAQDPSPIPAGKYQLQGGTFHYLVRAPSGGSQLVIGVSEAGRPGETVQSRTEYRVVFDQLESGRYLAQATDLGTNEHSNTRNATAYVVVWPRPTGFDVYEPGCAAPGSGDRGAGDGRIATEAGAVIGDYCKFSAYAQVRQAAQGFRNAGGAKAYRREGAMWAPPASETVLGAPSSWSNRNECQGLYVASGGPSASRSAARCSAEINTASGLSVQAVTVPCEQGVSGSCLGVFLSNKGNELWVGDVFVSDGNQRGTWSSEIPGGQFRQLRDVNFRARNPGPIRVTLQPKARRY